MGLSTWGLGDLMIKQFRGTAFAACVALGATGLCGAVLAQDTSSEPVKVQLNKLKSSDSGCTIYVVVDNETGNAFKNFSLDLVLFNTGGVVDHRVSVDLGPLRKNKQVVKVFDLKEVKCDGIGRFLVNDINECNSDAGVVDNCFARLQVSSLVDTVKFMK
ncbi:MAG: hypothetical protein RIC14_06440 [Filomicrobium sp.]